MSVSDGTRITRSGYGAINARFPLPDLEWALTAPFWEGAANHELRVPRCDACSAWVWYPAATCPTCRSSSIGWVTTAGRGTLYTWTVVRHVFLPAFADRVPYVTGLVTLEEHSSLRMAAAIHVEPTELRVDLPLEVAFAPLRFSPVDHEVVAPFFRPGRSSI